MNSSRIPAASSGVSNLQHSERQSPNIHAGMAACLVAREIKISNRNKENDRRIYKEGMLQITLTLAIFILAVIQWEDICITLRPKRKHLQTHF